jgi:hypothetical protein
MATVQVRTRNANKATRAPTPLTSKDNYERTPNAELREAIEDVRLGRNLYGPYKTVAEAMKAMLEDD